MKRLLSLLLLLSAMQSVAAVPAAADVPAAGRADAILAGVSDGFRALGAYGVSFEVRSDEYVTRGRYAVEGEGYYLVLGDAEVYCDGAVRYEVDNRRREVTVTEVDAASRNILNNPVRAFDFLGSEYTPLLVSEADGRAVDLRVEVFGGLLCRLEARDLKAARGQRPRQRVPDRDHVVVFVARAPFFRRLVIFRLRGLICLVGMGVVY